MTQHTAFRVGVGGVLAGALALAACAYSALLPYRLSPTQDQIYGVAAVVELIALGLAIALGVVSQWGDVRSRRLGYVAIALGILALVAGVLTGQPHSVSRPSP